MPSKDSGWRAVWRGRDADGVRAHGVAREAEQQRHVVAGRDEQRRRGGGRRLQEAHVERDVQSVDYQVACAQREHLPQPLRLHLHP